MKLFLKSISLLAFIILVWGILLPGLSRTSTIRQRQLWLEDNGIDPAAMFYTELPRMMSPSRSSSHVTAHDEEIVRSETEPRDGRRIDESL
ncbi:MAG: hypothetical protein AAGJ83_07230 [Planctomycetota bacterium]